MRAIEAAAELAPYARDRGVRLALEPMHPIFAADRGVVSTLGPGYRHRRAAPRVGRRRRRHLPRLVGAGALEQIARAAGRIVSYQVCEWITPLPADTLLSRDMMRDGHIDFAALTNAVAAAGYAGDVEVEIFNADVWAAPGEQVVATQDRGHTWIEGRYNRRRRHSAIGMLTPVRFETAARHPAARQRDPCPPGG